MTQPQALVLGLGVSGLAAAQFLLHKGYAVTALDVRASTLKGDADVMMMLEKGLRLYHEHDAIELNGFELAVVSPGVPPTHPLYCELKQRRIEVIGEIELACRYLKQSFIGITGTNGKTTVTLLVTHVLNACGISAQAVGNVGVPLISVVEDNPDSYVLVVELSSWQLETLQSHVVDAAVVLNVTPDHLDRHTSMAEYAQAKFAMGRCLKPGGKWWIHDITAAEYRDALEKFPQYSTYGYLPTSDVHCDQNGVFFHQNLEYYLPQEYRGFISHDVENEMAAFCLCREFGVTPEQFRIAVMSFQKPPHRNELVRVRRGVRFINDSKGTNVDAVVKAVASTRQGCILIAGGKDKGSSYAPWLGAFAGKVRYICAIGEAAPKILDELSPMYRVEIFSTLDAAVDKAAQEALDGEDILLSPGCASYDMFENYAHRGREFARCVYSLPE